MRQARPGGGCGACLAEEVRGGLQPRRRALAQDRAAQRGVRGRVRVDAGEEVGADGVEQRHVGRQELALVDVHERAQRQRRLILVRAPERGAAAGRTQGYSCTWAHLSHSVLSPQTSMCCLSHCKHLLARPDFAQS